MKQVCYARDAMEAHFLRGVLGEQGIRACVLGEALAAARGDLPLTQQTQPSVWVEDDDLEQACLIVRDTLAGHSPDALGPPWTCPQCGQAIESQFTHCWHCGHERPSDAADDVT